MATTAASLSSHGVELVVPTPLAVDASPLLDTSVRALSSSSAIFSFEPRIKAPFDAIRRLFDHLRANPENASSLNAAYPKRGIFKTAAINNATSDQNFTIDLSPARNGRIPETLREKLAGDGFNDVLDFFEEVNSTYVAQIMSIMHGLIGADLGQVHKTSNLNYRLCDYNTDTADPTSDNGCGAHTDYGTFTIIFQDGTSGLEIEDAEQPGLWVPVPGDATVVLAGWCAVILSGGNIRATRHRVRRTPGVRRLSAILFVAPDVEATLQPLEGVKVVRPFTKKVMDGQLDVGEFKEVMGKKWRRREGNEKSDDGDDTETQDSEIERFIWA
ncbi:oxidoreductase 2OG-Fe(II) oxygenase family [Fusarium mexicanum]|uniref:Oxidoreductase 2OG-Fe(II) oxygenase family n=1 Tax=Fusarium mexicanum TaxID=751941 RepID=A0A8H5J195_9HYPO|nr:oxidoreductase 2OG-Fe(II) oxygenase family [Fusarium mexicanum]